MRSTCAVTSLVATIVLSAAAAGQQPAPETPAKLEVGAIRRNVSGSGSSNFGLRTDRFVATNVRPIDFVMNAYRYEVYRIVDAPGWALSERYDVAAVANRTAAPSELPEMLKQFLAEHFRFAAHTETRPMQVYAMVPARSDGSLGPKIKRWALDCEALRKAGQLPPVPQPLTLDDLATPRPCGMSAGRGLYAAGGRRLDDLARSLAAELQAPVFDRTGLTGEFEMSLRWNPDPSLPGGDPSLPSLFTAIQEQLGLKLEARREPVDVLVIDRMERPAAD